MENRISFWWAIVPLVAMIAAMLITIVYLEQGPHMPLLFGTAVAALVAWRSGSKWEDIEEAMYKGIRLALPAIIIIILIGLIIGSWIGSGVVATMILYGLNILTPSLFLVSIAVICAVVSLAIGSSWSTMGTIGVAGMGIGLSMGIPAAMIAGAVISGSYFGDKMSPLSDTTNLAAGLTNTDLFVHIKHMWWTTVPGFIIALIVFWFLGRDFSAAGTDTADIAVTMAVLQESFIISPWLLLIPLAVFVMVAFKVPAIPALLIGALLGFLAQIFVQGGSLSEAVGVLQGGYFIETGNPLVDDLFNRGGLDSMMYTVSMILVAMSFGGILEYTGMLKAIMAQILKMAKTGGRLVASTVVSATATNAMCAEQYISIVVPSRMYASPYKEKNLASKNLSRALEDGGTLTSVFFAWNTCGVFILGTLGISAFEYAAFAVFNYMVPLISIIYGLTGFTIAEGSEEDYVTDVVQAE